MVVNPGGIGLRNIPDAGTDFSWYRSAACKGADPGLFFPPVEGDADYVNGEMAGSHAAHARYKKAIAICGHCAVIEACREYALSAPETAGVWGGMSPEKRKQERRRRNRAAARNGIGDEAH